MICQQAQVGVVADEPSSATFGCGETRPCKMQLLHDGGDQPAADGYRRLWTAWSTGEGEEHIAREEGENGDEMGLSRESGVSPRPEHSPRFFPDIRARVSLAARAVGQQRNQSVHFLTICTYV